MLYFEWDPAKSVKNGKKHGVSFEEAKSVFHDEHAIQFLDSEHSLQNEVRFLMLGMSNQARLLLVCHCERGNGTRIRIISARKATPRECAHYGRSKQ